MMTGMRIIQGIFSGLVKIMLAIKPYAWLCKVRLVMFRIHIASSLSS